MSKKLVAYFSATGRTAKVAKRLAAELGADIYEITPKMRYTRDDLNWVDKGSRSSIEMYNRAFRPEIITGNVDISDYDIIYLGFPIWWYIAPTVVNTFLEAYSFIDKKLFLFATSGGSGFGNTIAELRPSAFGAKIREIAVLSGMLTEAKIMALVELCR